jgi:hypothetical protein
MSPSLEIFVIFHKKYFPEMYEELDEEERKCFRFIAVNENIPKEGTLPDEYIKEWELPIYHREWQENNWMNGGVNHHIILNKLSTADYIGFVQYDMKFKKGSIHKLKTLLQPDVGISMKVMNIMSLIGSSTYGFHEFDLYNYAISQLPPIKSETFPLFHNCFMLREKYEEIMPNLLRIDSALYKFHNRPGDPIYRFPITTERTLALAIGSVVDHVIEFKEMTHERLIPWET